MGKAKRKKALPPRRLRMKRPARLQSAALWIPTYQGKNIVRGYAKWYGVDLGCALKELSLLDVQLDPVYVEHLKRTLKNRSGPRQQPSPEAEGIPERYGSDWDGDFAYIAGFTSGGTPFGVTWDDSTDAGPTSESFDDIFRDEDLNVEHDDKREAPRIATRQRDGKD